MKQSKKEARFKYTGIYVGDERVNNVRVKARLRKGHWAWISELGLQFDLDTGKFWDHDQRPLWRLLIGTVRKEKVK